MDLNAVRVGLALVPDDAGDGVMVQRKDTRLEVVAWLVRMAGDMVRTRDCRIDASINVAFL